MTACRFMLVGHRLMLILNHTHLIFTIGDVYVREMRIHIWINCFSCSFFGIFYSGIVIVFPEKLCRRAAWSTTLCCVLRHERSVPVDRIGLYKESIDHRAPSRTTHRCVRLTNHSRRRQLIRCDSEATSFTLAVGTKTARVRRTVAVVSVPTWHVSWDRFWQPYTCEVFGAGLSSSRWQRSPNNSEQSWIYGTAEWASYGLCRADFIARIILRWPAFFSRKTMAAPIDWWLDFNSSLLLDVLLNDTALLGNDSASAAGVWDDVVSVTPSYWCLLLLIFPTCTVFGNVLVCLSVYNEKALHTVTNYFISSLAIADIMVALLVMPLAVYVEVGANSRYLSPLDPNISPQHYL